MRKLLRYFTEKFTQAFVPCATLMVSGDLTALTAKHLMIAAKTGSITGVAATLTFLVFKKDTKWFNVGLVGLLTTVADALTHPTHFGSHELTEAVATGVAASFLAYLYHTLWKDRTDGKASKR